MVAEPVGVGTRLEAARRDLLDLGLRNSLINYRPLRSRGVEVVGESPAEIYRLLVTDGRTLTFEPAPEPAPQQAELPVSSPEPPAPEAIARVQTDRKLQTTATAQQLQVRLLNSYYAARTFIEEQGVNILFLALGMLEWYEADSSQEKRRAPLLLVPVLLERADARDRFHLRHSGEDPGDNISLTEMLKTAFGISAPPFPELEDLDVDTYFGAWTTAVGGRPRWRVDPGAIALGFFSFGKFLMYRDLDAASWPAESRQSDHPIIRALLQDGFHEPPAGVGDDAFLDRVVRPEDLSEVVDADSSQTLAILDARNGRNLVIQGPPGTGKSQTITNLIAEAIAAGKTVLFVAEKMAALEVVKRRLDSIGLGDACLELHSHRINKRVVLAELQRTLDLGRPRVGASAQRLSQLEASRARLNDYCDAVNNPLGETGLTPFQALGELTELQRSPATGSWPRLDIPGLASWADGDYARRLAIVEEFQARLSRMGVPLEHPFWGMRRASVLPGDTEQIREQIAAASAAEGRMTASAGALAAVLGLPAPADRSAALALSAGAHRLLEAPDVAGLAVSSPDWLARRADIDGLLAAGVRHRALHEQHDTTLVPEAWTADLTGLRRNLADYRATWWRFLSGRYRRAKRTLTGYCRATAPGSVAAQVQLVDDMLEAQRQAIVIQQHAALAGRLFGPRWQGERTDWQGLSAPAGWLTTLHADTQAGLLPAGIVDILAEHRPVGDVASAARELDSALPVADQALDAVVAALDFDASRPFGPGASLDTLDFDGRSAVLRAWTNNIPRIGEMAAYNVSAAICRDERIEAVVEAARAWREAGVHLSGAFRRARAAAVLERAFRERPALATFDGSSHAQVIDRFRALDTLMFAEHRARLALAHWQAMPKTDGGGQLAVLRREFEKRSRHLPVRQLMARAGNAIQAIKPVFMMSPLSIATYLPPGTVTFDIVVFDEASQVRPVDAFGALLRGRQAIVVGDNRQLPPTAFFESLTGDEESDEDVQTADYESILDLFSSASAPQRMLRWHYRSRHESLIAVSNQEFYENRLVVFPSPDAARVDAGLVYHHLSASAYDRGNTRTNRDEAAAVATAVMRHAHGRPDLTLGVAAFSVAQTQAIIDELERMRRGDPSAEGFFAAHPHEPFFVKNLENVQGDERDVIFISVGYGRTAEGYLAMNFGPLNAEGGERRLNVLITRARLRCEVFTNLTADDIDLNRSNARGVVALKRFLRYAETGILDVPQASGREADSPFEEAVEQALAGAGYVVQRQVGSAGFFIDLAVVDPERPGRYLLGIECDGASYHSARSARDRDRLRQLVLERLGWTIHRVWSVDWYRNPAEELRRVVVAIEDARARGGGDPPAESGASAPTVIERQDAPADPPAGNGLPPYRIASVRVNTRGVALHAVPTGTLARWVADVVEVESPVHADEVMRRVAAAAGVSRIGSRIHSSLGFAIANAAAQGRIVVRDGFLWSPQMQVPVLRDRAGVEGIDRSIGKIAPEELDLAICKVVAAAYGIDPSQVAAGVTRLLGFSRMTEDMRGQIDPRLQQMLTDGRLALQAGQVVTAPPGPPPTGYPA